MEKLVDKNFTPSLSSANNFYTYQTHFLNLDFNIGDDHDWIMESLVAEISESNNEGIFVLRQGGIAGIIIDRDGNVDIRKITNNIYQRLNKSIPLLTIGIGNSVNYPSEIRRGYHNAKSLTKNSFFNNNYIVEEESPRNS